MRSSNRNTCGSELDSRRQLPEGYFPEDIDIGMVALTAIDEDPVDPPLLTVGPDGVGDYDEDGILDLMVKFDRQEVISLLEEGDATLTVSGELLDGTPFEGSDTIRVISPGRGRRR